MLDSVKAIQAQQLYRVQPISLDEKSSQNKNNNQQQLLTGINMFTGRSYSPSYPSVENSPTLGRSLDLLG